MWKEKILEIIGSGMTQRAIANRLCVSQAHISDIANGKRGKRIGFDLGNAITALHREVFGRAAAEPAEKPEEGGLTR